MVNSAHLQLIRSAQSLLNLSLLDFPLEEAGLKTHVLRLQLGNHNPCKEVGSLLSLHNQC